MPSFTLPSYAEFPGHGQIIRNTRNYHAYYIGAYRSQFTTFNQFNAHEENPNNPYCKGWKLHVGVERIWIEAAWDLIRNILTDYEVKHFKVAGSVAADSFTSEGNREQGGKQITIYIGCSWLEDNDAAMLFYNSFITDVHQTLIGRIGPCPNKIYNADISITTSPYLGVRNDLELRDTPPRQIVQIFGERLIMPLGVGHNFGVFAPALVIPFFQIYNRNSLLPADSFRALVSVCRRSQSGNNRFRRDIKNLAFTYLLQVVSGEYITKYRLKILLKKLVKVVFVRRGISATTHSGRSLVTNLNSNNYTELKTLIINELDGRLLPNHRLSYDDLKRFANIYDENLRQNHARLCGFIYETVR